MLVDLSILLDFEAWRPSAGKVAAGKESWNSMDLISIWQTQHIPCLSSFLQNISHNGFRTNQCLLLEMNSADGKVTEGQKSWVWIYSNCELYCVFTNLNLYVKYEMWGFFLWWRKTFCRGRKRKTEKWRVGGRCLPLFVLLNFLHWSLESRLRGFVKVLQVVLNLTQALIFQVLYFCFIRSNFLLQRRLNIKSELWEISCWWVWAQGFF